MTATRQGSLTLTRDQLLEANGKPLTVECVSSLLSALVRLRPRTSNNDLTRVRMCEAIGLPLSAAHKEYFDYGSDERFGKTVYVVGNPNYHNYRRGKAHPIIILDTSCGAQLTVGNSLVVGNNLPDSDHVKPLPASEFLKAFVTPVNQDDLLVRGPESLLYEDNIDRIDYDVSLRLFALMSKICFYIHRIT